MVIYILLLIQSLIGSGTHIVAKVIVCDIDPVTLTLFRSIIASVGFLGLILFRNIDFKFDKGDYKYVIGLGILAVVFNQFLFLFAMQYTTPSNAALLYATTPTMVLLLSNYFYNEKITIKKSVGLFLAFIGVLLIIFENGVEFSSDLLKGNLLMLTAVISWALYTVLGRKLIVKYGSLKTSSSTLIAGAIIFFPIGIVNSSHLQIQTLTANQVGGLLYLGLGTSVIAYSIWYYAMKKTEPTKVAIFSNLQPVITTILSVVLLELVISPTFVLGGVIVISGVVLTQFSK